MDKSYLDTTGRIFDIQRFSVHDGPGVRTIIFLKGCVLRCKGCCNPESQSTDFETMITDGKSETVGRDVTVREVMETVERDRIFYRRSGGGVTLSGGECLVQPDFAAAILKACKDSGINTAIESTGCASYDRIEKLLPNLDVYLMDIKHTDNEKHKQFTGRSNELILENAKKIARDAKELIIRVPVIPGFNCQVDEIAGIAEFAKSLDGVEELHLLPYHNFGEDKYKRLGREYELKDTPLLPDGYVQKLKAVVESKGLKCQIGG